MIIRSKYAKSGRKGLIPNCAICHLICGIRTADSARKLFISPGGLSRVRRKCGVPDKFCGTQGRAGKTKNPQSKIHERIKQRKLRQAERLMNYNLNIEQRAVARSEKSWTRHPIVYLHMGVKAKHTRYKTDPAFKMIRRGRARVKNFLKTKRIKPTFHISKVVGCTGDFLKQHLEKQFKSGMNWNNHGTYWHVDHKVPLASAKTLEEVKNLSHWSNLQPLTAKENLSKGSR